MSESSEIPRESISVFSFMNSISTGQLILISSSISLSSFNKLLVFQKFLEHIISFKPTRNWPPLICLYWPKRISKGSLSKQAAIMTSYPSSNKSWIKLVWQLKSSYQSLGIWQGESELFKWWDPLITPIFNLICKCTTKFWLTIIFFSRMAQNVVWTLELKIIYYVYNI